MRYAEDIPGHTCFLLLLRVTGEEVMLVRQVWSCVGVGMDVGVGGGRGQQ